MTAMFPLAVWQPGTLQPSTPVNDNALRVEILQRGATSIISTPPGSPVDGQVHILGASPTGAWSTFAQNDVVMWRSGTWYRFLPFLGWLKQVGTDVRRFDGTSWVVVSGAGGGAVPVQDEGSTVVASPTAINFVGAGVTTTNSGGVATVTIPGGGGGSSALVSFGTWFAFITASSSSPFVQAFGLFVPSFTGSSTTGTISTTSPFTSLQRRNVFVASTLNAVVGQRGNDGLIYYLGDAARVGGFKISMTYGIEVGATTSTHRFFMGLRNSTSDPSDVEPSSYTNIIGIGYDAADTQVQLMHNDGSGTATKVALGASFPKPTVNATNMYTLTLETVAGSGVVSYTVSDRSNGATASGTITTNLPLGTQGLNHWTQLSAGGATAAMTLSFVHFAVEV